MKSGIQTVEHNSLKKKSESSILPRTRKKLTEKIKSYRKVGMTVHNVKRRRKQFGCSPELLQFKGRTGLTRSKVNAQGWKIQGETAAQLMAFVNCKNSAGFGSKWTVSMWHTGEGEGVKCGPSPKNQRGLDQVPFPEEVNYLNLELRTTKNYFISGLPVSFSHSV